MASNKRDLKAYVRYDGSGRVVPSSVILNRFKPKVGNYSEINAYECCNTAPLGPCKSFWIDAITSAGSGDLWSVGSAIDSNCNTFNLMVSYWSNPNNPNTASNQNFVLRKCSDDGTILWDKAFDFAEDGVGTISWMDAQAISIDNAGNIYAFLVVRNSTGVQYTQAFVKFDNDGNQLWSKKLSVDTSTFSITAQYLLDAKFDISDNIYLLLRNQISGGGVLQIMKLNPSGSIINTKYINIVNGSGNGSLNVNSNQEVYITSDDTVSKIYVIKLDSSLSEIWNKTITKPVNYQYTYGIQFDTSENVIISIGSGIGSYYPPRNDLGAAYVKISPSGSIIWANKIIYDVGTGPYSIYGLGTFQLDTDADGNIYISSAFPNDVPGYIEGPGNGYGIVIAKINTSGIFQWGYLINPPTDQAISTWYYYNPIAGNLKNNSLVLGCYAGGKYDTGEFDAQMIKLPLTKLTNGTYGPYTVSDIGNVWQSLPVSITLNTGSAVYSSPTINITNLTYLVFTETLTTTHIIL